MKLSQKNYHSQEANDLFISASQIKQVLSCEAKWNSKIPQEDTDVFLLGRYFETFLCGDEDEIEMFKTENPQMFSSRGASKGELKAEFKNIEQCIEAVKKQEVLTKIIQNADKQVIMTGEILNSPVKVMVDLILPKAKSIFDIKTTRNFEKIWSNIADKHVQWWEEYFYHMQLWIYSEIARQNNQITEKSIYGLIAACKKNADVQAIQFSQETLENGKQLALYGISRINAIKGGQEPVRCEKCDYCISTKKIKDFEVV